MRGVVWPRFSDSAYMHMCMYVRACLLRMYILCIYIQTYIYTYMYVCIYACVLHFYMREVLL